MTLKLANPILPAQIKLSLDVKPPVVLRDCGLHCTGARVCCGFWQVSKISSLNRPRQRCSFSPKLAALVSDVAELLGVELFYAQVIFWTCVSSAN